MTPQDTAFVEARDLVKGFGGAQALKGVDLSLESGEVHGLVGENGAGKSTLGKCLAGVHRPDEGAIFVEGNRVDYKVPRDALDDGITIVEQELALVPAMTVADNVLLGRQDSGGRLGARRGSGGAAEVQRISDDFGLALDARARVEDLTIGERQKVEILRGISRGARLIVMDEPTARLARPEADHLLEIVRTLASRGTTIVYVSHFLSEVLQVSDRVTVMRNGEIVRTASAKDETPSSLVKAMLGRAASLTFPDKLAIAEDAAPILEVKNLGDGELVSDVSFDVRPGEIVGLGGLVGSGRSEVARLIFGAERSTQGEILFDGKSTRIRSVRQAVKRGIAYLPESRRDLGLFLNLSIQENVTLPHLSAVSTLGVLSASRERRETRAIMSSLEVKARGPATHAGALSGGNQQKVLFSKWLWQTPRILIADEPTRGVDVGAKFAIYRLLADLAARGTAVLLISSEIDELVGLSHRVVVMARGRTVAMLTGEAVSEDQVLHSAFDSDVNHGEKEKQI